MLSHEYGMLVEVDQCKQIIVVSQKTQNIGTYRSNVYVSYATHLGIQRAGCKLALDGRLGLCVLVEVSSAASSRARGSALLVKKHWRVLGTQGFSAYREGC
jgi:hypothetical protein